MPRSLPNPSRRSVLATLAGGIAFGWRAPVALAQATPEPATVRIGAASDEQSKPVLYAQQAGLFAREGLNVTIVPLNGGGAAIAAAVTGGSLDMGKTNMLQLISAHARGVPFTIVAPAVMTGAADRGIGLIVAADSPVRSAREFNDKTVGVTSLVTIELIATRAWIDKNGGDSRSVHFVEVAPAQSVAAIEQGRIIAATILEPTLTQAVGSGKVRILAYPYGAIAPRFDGAAWFTTVDYATKHPDIVKGFEHAIHDANVYVGAHENETIPLIAKYTGIDPSVLAGMKHPERPAYLSPTTIQPLIAAAVRYGFIPKPFPAQEMFSPLVLKPPR